MRRRVTALGVFGLSLILGLASASDSSRAAGPALPAGPGAVGAFLGVTLESRAGDLGGPVGADRLCRRVFSESHMCSYDEIDAARVARAMVHDAWIGPPTKHFWASNLQTANGSCREWHTGQVGLGSVLNNDGTLRLLPCSIPRRVACCGCARR